MPFPSFPRAGKLKRRENSDHLAGHHSLQMHKRSKTKPSNAVLTRTQLARGGQSGD